MSDHPRTRATDTRDDDTPLCLLPPGITFYGSSPQQLYKALCDRMNLRGVPIYPSADPKAMLDNMNQHQLLMWSASVDPAERQTAMNIALTTELCHGHDWAMEACETTGNPNQFHNVWRWIASQVATEFHLVSELDQLDSFQAAGIGEIAISIIGQSLHMQRMRDINNGEPDESLEQVPFEATHRDIREPVSLGQDRGPGMARRYRRGRSLIGRVAVYVWRAITRR